MAREMKDSGIEWIGEIPLGWSTRKVKYVASIKSGEAISKEEYEENGSFPVIGANGVIGHTSKQNNSATVISTGRVGTIGTTHIVDNAWISDNSLIVQVFFPSTIKYIYWTLPNFDYQQMTSGTAMPLITATKLLNQTIPYPSIEEQHRIADFLDRKCAEIDRVLEKTRASIEEYKKLKQSVITQAVTKGIRGEREMKDSGIEWIGEIPIDWEFRKIKHSFYIVAGATPKSEKPEFWDGDICWITPADYKTNDKYIVSGRRNISVEGLNSCGTTIVPKDSIVFSKRAPIGSVAITAIELCTNQGCLACVTKASVNVLFFYYLLSVFSEQFELFGSGTTFKEISTTNFANFVLPYPSLAEQIDISTYLDRKCAEIDTLISKKEQLITELETYKKSLIYEYVTGKKEVQ